MFRSLTAAVLALCAMCVTPAAARTLDEIVASGEIRIGVSEFAPWTFTAKDGALAGHEIEIGRRIAADMGLEPAFKLIPWGEIIDALEQDEIDLIAAGMAITPSRALRVAFTRPYFFAGATIAANHEKTKDLRSVRELNDPGVTLSVVRGTLAEEVATRLFPEAERRVFDAPEAAEAEVLSGAAAAYVASTPEVGFLALRHPDVIDEPLSEPLVASRAGFAVRRRDQQLLNFLNAWIEAREADLWLPAAYERWFQSIAWMEDVAP